MAITTGMRVIFFRLADIAHDQDILKAGTASSTENGPGGCLVVDYEMTSSLRLGFA